MAAAAAGFAGACSPADESGPQEDGSALPTRSQTGTADFCVALANHWSYTGIGWQLGLESCAQSIRDSLAMADYSPSVKTCLNLDALAYSMVAESYPDIAERLRRYLAEGKVEIIGGSYGQPLASMVSGESNLRQLVMGQKTIQETLGVLVSTFLEEEEFTHPQLPQLLKGAGYQFASMAQCDTWGKHGSPPMDLNLFPWRGIDGTCILATPINGLVFHPPVVTHDIDWLWTQDGRHRVAELQQLGMPLAIKWTEFGWEDLGGQSINKFDPEKFRLLSQQFRVRYVTLTEYLEQYSGQAKEPVSLRMDDFHKLLPWGVGGDQLRRYGREVEALLIAAERFDAINHLLSLGAGRVAELEEAWKHLLIAQSHDVSLCEYSRWGGGTSPPLEPLIAAHFLPWGSIGFHHMDHAKQGAQKTLHAALREISASIDTATESKGDMAIVVFNPCDRERDANASSGRLYFQDAGTAGISVRDAQGREVASQLLQQERDPSGAIVAAEVAFQVRQLPPVGYATYYLAKTKSGEASSNTDLKTSESGFRLENEYVAAEIDPQSGAIVRLVDRRQGTDLIDGKRCPFPIFTGRPNKQHPASAGAPDAFNSRQSKAEVSWVERGPLRATVKAVHTWPRLRFENWVTLQAGQPFVESRLRVFADVPPAPGEGTINGWQFPLEITEGYWASFAPAFQPAEVIRDFPFGVEATAKAAIDALSFLDLMGPQGGLLIVHSGTQYFKRGDDGVFSNLLIREWESHFTGEYGWPRVADYRFALQPHGAEFTHADRLRAVAAFDQRPVVVVETLHPGRLAKRRSFVSLGSAEILLSTFRAVADDAYELRVIEQSGLPASAELKIDLPLTTAAPCDFLGRVVGETDSLENESLAVSLTPWQIRMYRLGTVRSKPATRAKG